MSVFSSAHLLRTLEHEALGTVGAAMVAKSVNQFSPLNQLLGKAKQRQDGVIGGLVIATSARPQPKPSKRRKRLYARIGCVAMQGDVRRAYERPG
jgi:hypothetical protein